MGNLHHELWIVQVVNELLGPPVRSLLQSLGFQVAATGNVIPDYLVMCGLIVLFVIALGLVVRSSLSVEQPGKLQIVLEDMLGAVLGMLKENIGPKGPAFLPLIGSVGLFIFIGNMMGKVPGLTSPTANINVTLGCAITVWVYYHAMGVREQGIVSYLKHFAVMPGMPIIMAPLVLIIEVISHMSRVMSLALRLFGNVFGEEMVVAILASLVPFIVPLPMMVLGMITGTLQAFIFMLLTMIYLAAAVHTDHEHDDHIAEAPAHASA